MLRHNSRKWFFVFLICNLGNIFENFDQNIFEQKKRGGKKVIFSIF